jgi:uncharacterized protein YbjT (DUF2867 family)
LIGAAVVARLIEDGHEVTGIARHVASAARRLPHVRWVAFDMAGDASAGLWHPLLDGVGGIVNCAGALQDSPADSLAEVHERGLGRLIAACETAGVRRFVHFSAIGIDRETPTRFSQTKRAGEEALMRSRLDWIILRPSVVVGRAAYGGSAVIRGLAALPMLPAPSPCRSLSSTTSLIRSRSA